jgi:hypothetical protein
MSALPQGGRESLDLRAREVLRLNDRGGYTVPNGRVYPFQWNWDSAFVALGFAEFDYERAWREVESLFEAQWPDGFVPHIVFWKFDPGYFPGPEIWGTGRTPATSGITQPPVAATVVRALCEAAPRDAAYLTRLERLFPKLLAWHRWFARVRDPIGKGVVVAVHPWETGRDNSPEWDFAAQAIDTSRVGDYQRRDTTHLDAAMRPRKLDYDRYVALLQFGRALQWDHARIGRESPFRVADVGMTMILLRAHRDLLVLAECLGRSAEAAELRALIERTEHGIGYLWDERAETYCSRDLVSGEATGLITSASFLSFYAGLRHPTRDAALLKHLERIAQHARYLLPSLDPAAASFDAMRYWRGPVWAVVNFMAARGLAEAGHASWAERIRRDTAQLALQSGLYEAYCPLTGGGTGGNDFSWTAAMWLHWARAGAT